MAIRGMTKVKLSWDVFNYYCEKVWVGREGVAVDIFQAFGNRGVLVAIVAPQSGPNEEAVGEGQRKPGLNFVGKLAASWRNKNWH